MLAPTALGHQQAAAPTHLEFVWRQLTVAQSQRAAIRQNAALPFERCSDTHSGTVTTDNATRATKAGQEMLIKGATAAGWAGK